MKNFARKFLSLLLVFVMVCGMLPAAMAATSYELYLDQSDNLESRDDYYYEDEDVELWVDVDELWCDDEEVDYDDYYFTFKWYGDYYDAEDYDDFSSWAVLDTSYDEAYVKCTVKAYKAKTKTLVATEYVEWDLYCDDYYYAYDYDMTVEKDDDMTGKYYELDEDITVSVTATLWDKYDNEVDAEEVGYYFFFDWEGDLWDGLDDYDEDNYSGYSCAYPDTSLDECEVECTVYVFDDHDDYDNLKDAVDEYTVTWKLYSDDEDYDYEIVVEAEVDNSSDGQYFDEVDDGDNDPIEDLIAEAIWDEDDDYLLEYVTFINVTADGGSLDAKKAIDYYYYDCYEEDPDDLLGYICFFPEEDYVGEVEFYFVATCYDENDKEVEVDGVLVIDVQGDITGDSIYYMVISGDNVDLDEDDLYYFWDELYPTGALSYVKFDFVSSGNLYDGYTSSTKKGTDVESKASKCYLNPTDKQIGLDDLTYVPSKNTTTATISFTAYGTTKKNGTTIASAEGNIQVLYTKTEIEPIEYTADDNVTLDADDFIDQYKELMGVSKAPTFQIKLLDTPIDGTLYMNYKVGSAGKVTGTKLTATNIESYSFSSSKTAVRSIEDVTYLPGTGLFEDSIDYAVYIGNTLKYIGTLKFNSAPPVVINMNLTTMGGTFKVTDFFNINNASLLKANYIIFGVPTSGTLYKNYSIGGGTQVVITDKFAAYSNAAAGYIGLNELTFIPASIGLVEIPFMGVISTGSFVSGTVKINVTAATFTDVSTSAYYYNAVQWAVLNQIVTGTTSTTFSPNATCTRAMLATLLWRAKGCPEPKTTVNPFSDIPAGQYYTKAVLWAAEQGIVNGRGNGIFDPHGTCTNNEVITMLWRANGKPATVHSGTKWYDEAVTWANNKAVLSGTGKVFNGSAACPRCDIVTYMYRVTK